MFAKKIGVGRCFIVKPLRSDLDRFPKGALKDANDALRCGVDLQAMIDQADPPAHRQIATFKHLREQVLHEIRHPVEYNGTPLRSLPTFTKAIKGFRKGEMSVITGKAQSTFDIRGPSHRLVFVCFN
jgi:twinkle protein